MAICLLARSEAVLLWPRPWGELCTTSADYVEKV